MKGKRLKQLIQALGLKPANFEKKCLGESRAKNIYNWINDEFGMKEAVLEKIIESVKKIRPDFNGDWLRYGTGEMFFGSDSEAVKLPVEYELQMLKHEVEALRRENGILKIFLAEKGVDLRNLGG
ncbi:hypothetical protein FHS57_002437 [Runella defluvii]|uniref:Uncharacterized protein n=1 Tax=Runella defluvii TaxID=370973 RepID=A0A7W5ZJH8_9BACT|nr:hypothetical protein [Runella defluvii]MBB3838432.1 hypothetical protein [Runella defluvii]